MKIENSGIPEIERRKVNQISSNKASAYAQTTHLSGSQKTDQAELSKEALLLAKALSAPAGTDKARLEKIDNLKKQIESGEYKIPYEELAQKIMDILKISE